MNVRLLKWGLFLTLLLSLSTGVAQSLFAQTGEADASIATRWYDLQLDLVKATPGFAPPVAARAFGYTGVALYEATRHGVPGQPTLVNQLNELSQLPQPEADKSYVWPIVANYTLAEMTRYMYPNLRHAEAIDALEAEIADELADTATLAEMRWSADYGRAVAGAVYEWSLDDGGYEGHLENFSSDFVPPESDGLWVPTDRPGGDPLPALLPYWGENRTMAIGDGSECIPPPPPAYSTDPESAFYKEAYEVYDTVKNITAEQNEIALFWADDPGLTFTPPGHSVSILNQVIEAGDYDLYEAAEAYARLGIAVNDAFISVWYTKYVYNLIRPITYIRQYIEPTWNTPFITDPVVTPPFPEYTSGHSVQSGAAAGVLTGYFGDNYAFTDRSHVDRGLAPRSFESFNAFADEAAISRLYGGIHFRSAIEIGVEQGQCVARSVNALDWGS